MTPTEIITADSERLGIDPQMVLGKIGRLVEDKACHLLQENDSLLVLIPLKDGDNSLELHLYTAGSATSLPRALKVFIEKIRNSDAKKVYGSGEIPQTLELLKRLGVDVQDSDRPEYKWMAPV
jgi:hypothetical protein